MRADSLAIIVKNICNLVRKKISFMVYQILAHYKYLMIDTECLGQAKFLPLI